MSRSRFRCLPALALMLPLTACAHSPRLVSLELRDLERGYELPQYPHAGRHYVEGQPGHRYALELQNLTGQRVLAVVSVDGVNVISGQTAGAGQTGYVLDPWQRLEVRGWRKNMEEIAEFHFTALEASYAARTGRPDNVGVIGVAAFRELPPPPPPMPVIEERGYSRQEAAAAPMAKAASAPAAEARADAGLARDQAAEPVAQQLGTGHGERRYDRAFRTTFERESSRPNQVLSLYYDSTEALIARGILPRPQPQWREPDPFPVGFVPDP